MLCYLSIKNIVLIEKLELAFDEGFTVLTGETGAGKSIIVDAISLILGKRSERRLIRKGQEAANVTALFKIPHSHIAINFANENGFIIKKEIILRRQILSNGRSQCFLNDEAISLSFMKDISSLLIEVHGQNDQAGLLDSSNHIHILDDWYNLLKNIKIVSKNFFILKEHTKKYNQYVADLNDLENKKNYLAEDLEELINLDLKDNEIDTLIRDRNYLMSIEKIRESLNKINYFIQGEVDTKGIYENLSLAKNQVSTIIPLNIEKFKDLDESIDRAMIELKEVEISLEGCLHSVDESNLSIDDIEKRITFIRQVSRKHNVEINDLNQIKNTLEMQLSSLSSNKADLKKLEYEIKALREAYVNESKMLSNLRSKASIKLAQAVNKEFPILKLDNAILKSQSDSYRRIRNTARFFLSNLNDFDPSKNLVPFDDMLELDRWAIGLTIETHKEILAAYDGYQFHQIYQKLHNFCVTDMGGFYLNIIKDRQYTCQKNSVARRSAQTAIYYILEYFVRWIAPILSFTADEIWTFMPGDREETVFFAEWQELTSFSEGKIKKHDWKIIIETRNAVNRILEEKKADGIQKSLEAEVTVYVDESLMKTLEKLKNELRFIFNT